MNLHGAKIGRFPYARTFRDRLAAALRSDSDALLAIYHRVIKARGVMFPSEAAELNKRFSEKYFIHHSSWLRREMHWTALQGCYWNKYGDTGWPSPLFGRDGIFSEIRPVDFKPKDRIHAEQFFIELGMRQIAAMQGITINTINRRIKNESRQ